MISIDDVALAAGFLVIDKTNLPLFDDGFGVELVSNQVDYEDSELLASQIVKMELLFVD